MPIWLNRKIREGWCPSLKNAHCKCLVHINSWRVTSGASQQWVSHCGSTLSCIRVNYVMTSALFTRRTQGPCVVYLDDLDTWRAFAGIMIVFYSSGRIGYPDLNILWFSSIPPEHFRDGVYYNAFFTHHCRLIRARLNLHKLNSCFFGHMTTFSQTYRLWCH